MTSIKVNCENIEISNDNKICIIAGPCQLETEQHAMDMAGKIQEITKKFDLYCSTNLYKSLILLYKYVGSSGLFKLIGYDLELKSMVSKETINGENFYYVSGKDQKKYVPSFLIENNKNEKNLPQILNGLKLVSDFLDKSILKPNNITHPKSRIDFLNIIKN